MVEYDTKFDKISLSLILKILFSMKIKIFILLIFEISDINSIFAGLKN